MAKVKTINIHGKEYVEVSERVRIAHEDLKQLSIETKVLPIEGLVVIKATIITPKGVFTGISAANPAKAIEKQNPYEVAETSAVGRALGFAGYGLVQGIASADEMKKAIDTPINAPEAPQSESVTPNQVKLIYTLSTKIGLTNDQVHAGIKSKFNKESINNLTKEEASGIIKSLMDKVNGKSNE